MRNQPVSDVPVLVVGAGPAGLMTAIALAREGVECLLVERRPELSRLPRATAISIRSMELLRAWGLEEEVRAGGVDAEWSQWHCETLAQASTGYGTPTSFPTAAHSAVISPTAPACVPQDHLEPVLLRHLRSLVAARVELGTEVVDVDTLPDGVRVVLRDSTFGGSRVVEARYLVAADGAHSFVRDALGIRMHGPDHLAEAVSVLFRAPLRKLAGDNRYFLYAITHPEAEGVLLPAGGDRWLYGVMGGPGQARAQDFNEETMTRRIQIGSGSATLRPQIERIGSFTFAAQMAERFRSGNAFLAGDAAHRATPRGGTGMNTAIHDGYDLGWKLAWVLGGWAAPKLLDSYETERRPVSEHNVARSRRPKRHGARGRSRAAHRPGRTHQAHLGADGRRPRIHARPAGLRADAAHRPPAGTLADGGSQAATPAAARRREPGRDQRTSARHPQRRGTAGPPRRLADRLACARHGRRPRAARGGPISDRTHRSQG